MEDSYKSSWWADFGINMKFGGNGKILVQNVDQGRFQKQREEVLWWIIIDFKVKKNSVAIKGWLVSCSTGVPRCPASPRLSRQRAGMVGSGVSRSPSCFQSSHPRQPLWRPEPGASSTWHFEPRSEQPRSSWLKAGLGWERPENKNKVESTLFHTVHIVTTVWDCSRKKKFCFLPLECISL